MEQPSISIALCTFNGEKYLRQFLESLLNQTIMAQEIIIVDDGSTDGTLSILNDYVRSFDFIKLFPQKENLGPVSAFKMAISLTQHNFILLADQDDIWRSNKIEKLLSKANSIDNRFPGVIYSDLEMIDEKGKTIFNSFWDMANLSPSKATFKGLMMENVITGSACMINDAMREEIRRAPDGLLMHDHWIALIAYGFGQYVYTEEKLVKYRVHNDSVTEKVPVNFFWRAKNQFLQLFKFKKMKFLEKEIKQMEQYSQLYHSKLSLVGQQELYEFLSLKNKTFLERKIFSYIRKNAYLNFFI